MPELRCSNTGIFSVRHVTGFLHLETTNSIRALCLGVQRGMLNSKFLTESTKTWKRWHLNRWLKGHLFTAWKLKAELRGASCHLMSDLNWACEHWRITFFTLCMSTNDQKKHQGALIWGLQIHFRSRQSHNL